MINEKQFLKNLREAVKRLKARPVLEEKRLRFALPDVEGRYCPITLLCIHRKMVYYDPSFEVKKAARLVKIPAALREEINHAADHYPLGYSIGLRRKLFRAAGRWK